MGRKRRGHKKRRPTQSVTHANVRSQALWERWIPTDLRSVLLPAALIELFLLGLFAVIPVGGVTLSLSPLARAWPWLLAPARLLAGNALVDGSVPPEQNPAALALVATLLVGASCAAGLAVLRARPNASGERRLLVILLGITLLFGVTMLLLPSLPSDDVFSYILYGRISVVHHANPLVAAPPISPAIRFSRASSGATCARSTGPSG